MKNERANTRIAERLSGLGILCFGLLMLLWIIPGHTETVSYGWMRPQTLPAIACWGLVALGITQTLIANSASLPASSLPSAREFLRALLAAALVSGAIWAMGRFGYLPVAPLLSTALLLLLGARRWEWFAIAALAVPIAIWLITVPLLGRVLP
ncbi:MAG: putative tricarboxylic transport membrane protein [Halocynthiibacter sp.]|jgi:putative tricarboxylic transport membrane protein